MRMKHAAYLVVFLLFFCAAGHAFAEDRLIVYTSMKDSLMGKLRAAFLKGNPGIELDYQSAGAGKLMAKIAEERKAGEILADVIWTSEVPDFYRMRQEGILEKYISPAARDLINPFDDYDGSFTAARLGTLGIAYNTKGVRNAPTAWSDLGRHEYRGAFAIANPAQSGTAYMSVVLLVQQFGWEFFDRLRANNAKIGGGSGQVVADTASGNLVGCLAVDYVTFDQMAKGAPVALAYPPEMLLVPSPIAIFRNRPNMRLAKRFLDFMFSREAQTIIAGEGTLPVRYDVTVPARFNLPSPAEAMKRSIKVDYKVMIADKEKNVKYFMDSMQGGK